MISTEAIALMPPIAWVALPFLAGFSVYLLPQLARYLALLVSLVSLGLALPELWNPEPLTLTLLDNFGVTLLIDSLSGYFIVTNALVTAAVLLYCWRSDRSAFFYTQAIALHGSVNAVFICADFISLYVALEVISVAAFLLIAYPRTNRAIWVALRYLFISNTAMLFYLMGAALVYRSAESFRFDGLAAAPPEAIALIFLGLLTKGGVFVSGLWLPLTHSEAETPVSALLSGVVVKTGVFPLVRCALIADGVAPILGLFGVATALLGVVYAIFEPDTKRTLAFSTISQIGFILAAPAAAGGYALTHGLAKAVLFLTAGNLPSRRFDQLQQMSIHPLSWLALTLAGLSVAGFPFLGGFGTKVALFKLLAPWQAIALNVAAVGTAIVMVKFIVLPYGSAPSAPPKRDLWLAVGLLLIGLVVVNGLYLDTYTWANAVKALLVATAGWLAYHLLRRSLLKLPQTAEQFDHLIGTMSLVVTLLFWMVLT
ncbi:MAG: cation:proton antiporter [Elainellaceae cyanobacterium]